ncbi:MAG: aromatic aminobenezylarsenical efflux permease ArsG family transporter [Isosphaeraceae bacterium]
MSGYESAAPVLGVASALWLGILTSISPCPLATNIAAISYISRRVGSPKQVVLSGTLYTLGRSLAYVVLGALLVASVLSIPQLSMFLQKYMNKLLGPLLILVAMFLLDLIRLRASGCGLSEGTRKRVDALGLWGALPLGVVFALTFCPVSAALFFGSLVPLAVQARSSLVLPGMYGVGTAVPALAFAVLIALGVRSVGRAFNALTKVEKWARRVTGIVFLIVGIYYALKFDFNVI